MITIVFTRQQYMNNECSHNEYYSQFVTQGAMEIVKRYIGLNAIMDSTDESFNDIPLKKWDSISVFMPTADLRLAGDFPSLAGCVCIAKQAARIIKEQN